MPCIRRRRPSAISVQFLRGAADAGFEPAPAFCEEQRKRRRLALLVCPSGFQQKSKEVECRLSCGGATHHPLLLPVTVLAGAHHQACNLIVRMWSSRDTRDVRLESPAPSTRLESLTSDGVSLADARTDRIVFHACHPVTNSGDHCPWRVSRLLVVGSLPVACICS